MSLWRSFECEKYSEVKLVSPVLDVGCGDGFFARTVFGKTIEMGIDLDERELALAAKNGGYRKVLRADATRLPFASKSYKTVISNCVLEHVPNIQKAFDEISRVLKPGGRLIITVPSEYYDTDSFFQKWLKLFGFLRLSQKYIDGLNRVFKHYHVNDAQTWERRFKKSGLKLEKAEYFISVPVYHAYERWLIPAAPSKFFKLIFNRWVLTPRFWVKWIVPVLIRKVLRVEDPKGVAYFLIARKR